MEKISHDLKVQFPTRTALARARGLAERRLTLAEVQAALDAPLSESERASILSLVRWFRRRYPTPIERLAYVRRTADGRALTP